MQATACPRSLVNKQNMKTGCTSNRASRLKPHFYKNIHGSSALVKKNARLRIPPKFYKEHGKTLSSPVRLRVSTGTTWEVQLSNYRNGYDLWLQEGWLEFATFYSINDGDVVLFRYEGSSLFHVSVFGPDGLEIQLDEQMEDDDCYCVGEKSAAKKAHSSGGDTVGEEREDCGREKRKKRDWERSGDEENARVMKRWREFDVRRKFMKKMWRKVMKLERNQDAIMSEIDNMKRKIDGDSINRREKKKNKDDRRGEEGLEEAEKEKQEEEEKGEREEDGEEDDEGEEEKDGEEEEDRGGRKPAKKKQKTRHPATETCGGSLPDYLKQCTHCQAQRTPQWRAGPLGPKTLCNACGMKFKFGRLFPEYRPARSPTFSSENHSNSHQKVLMLRKIKEELGVASEKGEQEQGEEIDKGERYQQEGEQQQEQGEKENDKGEGRQKEKEVIHKNEEENDKGEKYINEEEDGGDGGVLHIQPLQCIIPARWK